MNLILISSNQLSSCFINYSIMTLNFNLINLFHLIGFGGQRRSPVLPTMPSDTDEAVGLRLGPMLRLPHRNLLGDQTGPLGSQSTNLTHLTRDKSR